MREDLCSIGFTLLARHATLLCEVRFVPHQCHNHIVAPLLSYLVHPLTWCQTAVSIDCMLTSAVKCEGSAGVPDRRFQTFQDLSRHTL
jgi:hypothetical protein